VEKIKRDFKLTKNLMESNSNVSIPHFPSAELLVDKFNNFFTRKTKIIRNNIISDSPNNTCNISMDADIVLNGKILKIF